MLLAKNIAAGHKDLIHDVAYDFHGKRMATCSSDQSVKVWDMKDNEWHCTATWKAHSGSVWRVTWAYPEFGQVLATCSFDRTAVIWEESVEPKQAQWLKKATLVDSRTSVTDVKFAPKFLGLLLATCSLDGIIRIYEAPDVMNLNQWSLQHEIETKLSCSSLSWSPSRIHAPMIAVGSADSSQSGAAMGGKVQVFEYCEALRKWVRAEVVSSITSPVRDVAFAPNLGRSYHLLAVASKDLTLIAFKPIRKENTMHPSGTTKYEMKLLGQFDNHDSQVWRVSWNVTGTVLASSGDDGRVRMWKANYLDNWRCVGVLQGDGTSSPPEEEVTVAVHQRGDSLGR